MAQLKLMKKEWFEWFKGTTLENITAWTEYYYINPDSQHWISNYQLWDEVSVPFGSNGIRSNNFEVLPNTTYYFKLSPAQSVELYFRDKDGNDVGHTSITSNSTFTTPANCELLLFALYNYGSTTYNHDICINISNPTFNGHYEPRIIKIEDILEVVDMQSINWSYNSEYQVFYGYIPSKKIGRTNVFSTMYKTVDKHYRDLSNMEISGTESDDGVNVKNLNYNDPQAFRTAMKNVYLVVMKKTSPY